MTAIKMQVQKRVDIGTNSVKKMRNDNIIPAVVYSRGGETVHVSVDSAEFFRVYKEVGTSLLNLDIEGNVVPVIIKDIQRHPFKNQILHVDFQKINMAEKVKLTVPIILVNRDNIRLQPSRLMQLLDQIDIECLPSDIPNGAEIDVEYMDFSSPKFVKDLDIANNPDITILRDLEDAVCTLSEPTVRTEDEETTEDGAEVSETIDNE